MPYPQTLDDAAVLLRAYGLVVRRAGVELTARSEAPPGGLQDPSLILSVDLRMHESEWETRIRGGALEQHASLTDAVDRVIWLARAREELVSPAVHRDQFARCEADAIAPVIEQALIQGGWIEPVNPALVGLGLEFGSTATFRVPFPDVRLAVVVQARRDGQGTHRVRVSSYELSVQSDGASASFRRYDKYGLAISIPGAPMLTYRVALAVHDGLALHAVNLRWAVHHDPAFGNARNRPIVPESPL